MVTLIAEQYVQFTKMTVIIKAEIEFNVSFIVFSNYRYLFFVS